MYINMFASLFALYTSFLFLLLLCMHNYDWLIDLDGKHRSILRLSGYSNNSFEDGASFNLDSPIELTPVD